MVCGLMWWWRNCCLSMPPRFTILRGLHLVEGKVCRFKQGQMEGVGVEGRGGDVVACHCTQRRRGRFG